MSSERAELTPEQRVLRAQIAAHLSWSRTADRSARTAAARDAADARFERQVDPEGLLDPDERSRRARSARSAYFRQLALKSSRVRSLRSQERTKPLGEGSSKLA